MKHRFFGVKAVSQQVCSLALVGMLAIGAAGVATGLSGCSMLGGKKVATVDGTIINKSQYDTIYNQMAKVLNFDAGKETDPQKNQLMTAILQQMTLNKLILKTLIENDAKKLNIDISNQDLEAFKNEQLAQAGGKEQLEAFLKQNKMTEKDFDASLKEQLLMRKVVEKTAGDKLAVSDDEAKAQYQSNPKAYEIPERVKAKHILVQFVEPLLKKQLHEANPSITDAEVEKQLAEKRQAAREKADQVFAKVKKTPQEFGKLAQEYSEDTTSAKNGGNLNFLTQSFTDPVFWHALQKTPDKAFYPSVLQTMFGYHVIWVDEHQAAKQQTFEEAKPAIVKAITEAKRQQLFESWVTDKKKTATIKVEDEFMPKAPQATAENPGTAPGATPGQAPAQPSAPTEQPKAAGGKS